MAAGRILWMQVPSYSGIHRIGCRKVPVRDSAEEDHPLSWNQRYGCFREGRTDFQYKRTAIQHLMKAKSTLEAQHRGVKVFVPLVTLSRLLSKNEQLSIREFNTVLKQTENFNLIPSMPENEVATVSRQPIHYDEVTATRMLAAWADHLERY